MMKILRYIIFLLLIAAINSPAMEPPQNEIEEKVDSLFVIASSGQIKYRDLVAPAIDSLAAMKAPAVPRLIDHYDTKSARERHTINNILVKIGSDAVPDLLQAIDAAESLKRARICYTLGNIKDSSAIDKLISISSDTDWQVRSNVATALGKIGDTKAENSLLAALSDSVEIVRKSAAVACGKLKFETAIPILVHLLGDPFYGSRMTASEALVNIGETAIPEIIDSLDSPNRLLGNLGCTTLGKIGGEQAAFSVAPELLSKDSDRRALAVEAILLSGSSLACGFVEILAETEDNPLVRHFIDKVLQHYGQR